MPDTPVPARKHITEHRRGGLGELASTAICGNDITSSCLYVSALTIIVAGWLAPFVLLLVAGVLYLFRSIYSEVVGALPLNGGAYNALLNTTSKSRASIAACLTILSYMATAVISAGEGIHYVVSLVKHTELLKGVDDGLIGIMAIAATIILLAVFMGLTIVGITESAKVAIVIFITHLVVLTVLVVFGMGYIWMNGLGVLKANFNLSLPGGFTHALFFGFAVALLGISGFESSANFVEEQAEGVFPKTLRNMWIAVSVFNPLMAMLALALVPIANVAENKEALLAHMGDHSGGTWLAILISIDAALVLSGAVLTSFVGVTGLIHRMTLDRCLPQFLLKRNRRNTTHRIIIAFFVLCVSVLLITLGRVELLAGVYTLSFLAVMALFGIGNILLKVRRAKLPRPNQATWAAVLICILAMTLGWAGKALEKNEAGEYENIKVFVMYFVPALIFISMMLGRITLMKFALFILRTVIASVIHPMHSLSSFIRAKIEEINSQQIVFFTRGDNIANLNNAMQYVQQNEHTNRIKIVHVVQSKKEVQPKLEKDLGFLDDAYPLIDIEFVVVVGEFTPELIQELSDKWGIPKNLMFIGTHGRHFMYGLAELGGVRLII